MTSFRDVAISCRWFGALLDVTVWFYEHADDGLIALHRWAEIVSVPPPALPTDTKIPVAERREGRRHVDPTGSTMTSTPGRRWTRATSTTDLTLWSMTLEAPSSITLLARSSPPATAMTSRRLMGELYRRYPDAPAAPDQTESAREAPAPNRQ